MKHRFASRLPRPCGLLLTALLATAGQTAPAQAPIVTALSPARNLRNAPAGANVAVTFSQPMQNTAATRQAVRVFSAQRGGLMFGSTRGTATVSGNTITFDPNNDFRAGETVQVTATTAARSTGNVAPAQPHVFQFTTAVGGTGGGNFTAPATNPNPAVGNGPLGISTGDVDGDGDLDFVAPSFFAGHVSVQVNNGAGLFSPHPTTPTVATWPYPEQPQLADIDGDGDLDMVAHHDSNHGLSIRYNNGAGSFSGGREMTIPLNRLCSVRFGDVDGDGDLDFTATANSMFGVGFNDGTGNFSVQSIVPSNGDLFDSDLRDIDADGDLDLLVLSNQYGVEVWRNDGTGLFSFAARVSTAAGPFWITTGDLDGDGDVDFVTANYSSNTVSIRLNDGAGNFSPHPTQPDPTLSTRLYNAELVDVNGDGTLDLLIANALSGTTVSVRLNDGTGRFLTPTLNPEVSVGADPYALATGDLDGDGDLDFLTANGYGANASVRLNNPSAPFLTSFSPSTAVAGTPVTVLGAGLTGLTSFTVCGVTVPVASLTNLTANGFTFVVPPLCDPTQPVKVITAVGTATSTAFTPLLLVQSTSPAANTRSAPRTNSAVRVTFSETVRSFGVQTPATRIKVFGEQVGGLKAGNWTGGGTPTVSFTSNLPASRRDFRPGERVSVTVPNTILSGNLIAATPRVFQFTAAVGGTGRGSFQVPATGGEVLTRSFSPYGITGDVDNDGDLDLLVTNTTPSSVSVRLNNGAGQFSGTTDIPTSVGSNRLALGDVDNDGDLDLLVASFVGGVNVRLNNGGGIFGGGSDISSSVRAYDLALADFDADGDLDLAVVNTSPSGSSVNLYSNDGTGTFSGGANLTVNAAATDISVGDLDNDGDLDFVLNHSTVRLLSTWYNNGSGGFSARQTINIFSTALDRAALGDVDGDGDLDIVAVNAAANVFANDSRGNFTPAATFSLPHFASQGVLADVDADSDLDLLTANANNAPCTYFNDGTGAFATTAGIRATMAGQVRCLMAGDFDGDGDLDLAGVNISSTSSVSIRFNQPPAITGFSPSAAAAGTPVAVTGAGLDGLTAFSVNGVAIPLASLTNVTPTGFSFVVPAGLPPTGTTTATGYFGAVTSTGFTVRLRVTSTTPTANARAAQLFNSAVAVTFTEPVTAASATAAASAIRVFSSQTGGRKAGTWTGGGTSALSFASTLPFTQRSFRPGERVNVTVPATIRSAGGIGASPRVVQFTTAVGGTGRGNFQPPATNPDPAVGSSPCSVVPADVDGDGDLDFLTANLAANTVSVRFNDGTGNFSGAQTVSVGVFPFAMVTGDVDGDGDLDFATANCVSGSVSVGFNNGSGSFTVAPTPVAVGSGPQQVALIDVDADGDLDILTANCNSNTVSVRLNNGAGTFGAGADYAAGAGPYDMATGDVDADGDVDVLACNYGSSVVTICRNDGTGNFSISGTVAVDPLAFRVFVGDIDADDDLDLLTANLSSNSVSVRLNNGSGNFTAPATNAEIATPRPVNLVLGDLDADGDLDLVANSLNSGMAHVYLNNGTGRFTTSTTTPDVLLGSPQAGLALGDLDADGDLDLLGTTYDGNGTVNVRLNRVPGPVVSSFSPGSGPEGTVVTISGTGFLGVTGVTFNGAPAASFTVNSANSITATVPVGATSGPISVQTAANGAGTSATAFTVLSIYNDLTNTCLSTNTVQSTGSGEWQYLLAPNGQLAVAFNDRGYALGAVYAQFAIEDWPTLRTDGQSKEIFDRNWRLVAQNAAFAGRQIDVRFYALNSEFSHYRAGNDGDANDATTINQLNATQYDGPNQDCKPHNNDWTAPGATRLLRPQAATALPGANWFVVEVRVPDHFSEFYLHGGNLPLPVELVAFGAERRPTGAVDLTWRTAQERQNRGFVVERSADGRTFAAVSDLLPGQGTSGQAHEYAFSDEAAPRARLYYRLIQFDEDGAQHYSDVVTVQPLPAVLPALTLWPNPAHGEVRLSGTAGQPLEVLDATGRPVRRLPAAAAADRPLDLQGLPAGVYSVRAADGRTARLVVD